ncbi:hypothetical protein ONZ45_g11929 [Pleurotus djamor]|nr:hypothetical protein ONZ45_g11929 [Pleurotus djamor]
MTEPTPCLLLSSISITMRMDFIPLRGTHTPRWTEIQSLLLNPPSASFFAHLKQLNIRIVTSMDVKRNPIIGFVAGEMEGMMSGLGERGVLRVWMESEVGRGGEDDEEEQEEGEAVDWA